MRFSKLHLLIIAVTLFIAGCDSVQTGDTGYTEPYGDDVANSEAAYGENTYWAKDNLDLQRIGDLLEQADDAEEFEYLLNSEDGINNLDLNGDGYVDYVSVSEFDDRYDDQRGFSLFSRFGPEQIQEIARIIFDRSDYDDYDGYDDYNYPGARILIDGNDQIYGDDYYYETNWLDRSLAIADWIFSDRDGYYESPYYYNNYPDYYEVYPVVETPVYVTRIEQYYPDPIFVRTTAPTITNIKIKSKYTDRYYENVYAGLVEPTREQLTFRKNNPNRPAFEPVKRGKVKDAPPKFKEIKARNREAIRTRGNGNAKNAEARNNRGFQKDQRKNEFRNNPGPVKREKARPNNAGRDNVRPNKANPKADRPNNAKSDRVKPNNPRPNKAERPARQQPQKAAANPGKGNDKNRGGGGGDKGGGGNKGGGKGKGKP